MAKMSTDDLLDQFKEMTLLELSDFIKQFEETFDVKAATGAPVMMPTPAWPPHRPRTANGFTSSHVDRRQKSRSSRRFGALSLGLKEAKDLVDGAPKPVLERVAKEAADKAKETLEAAVATAEIK
jgi:large subunit ribosomal protein L7/L12